MIPRTGGKSSGTSAFRPYKAGLAVLVLAQVLAAAPAAGQGPALTLQVSSERIAPAVPPIFRYGGGVWTIPKSFAWVAPDILALGPGGTFRVALAWEVLAGSQDLAHLRRRLEGYRLNDFLRKVRAQGSEVIVSLDAMPLWLAREKSSERLPDGPAWARSVPADLNRWAEVVQAVVTHFNGRLGLDARYEVWNEPDHAFRGTLNDYFAMYRASVVGARRADPRARIGGPAVSDWSATGTKRDRQLPSKQLFLQKFFSYAALTAAPEVGLKRLPLDFVTWHGFYRNPATHYEFVAPLVRNLLAAAGYGDTLLIVDEWNIDAAPPYPEGDLNGSHVGAAYVAASMIAMNKAGINRQVFQMMVDPGGKGYSGGTFTPFAIPRPNFQTFRLFSMARGAQLRVSPSDSWLHGAAFADGERLYVLFATFGPTDLMFLRARFEPLAVERPELREPLERLERQRVFEFLTKGGAMPGGTSDAVRPVLQEIRRAWLDFDARRARWSAGPVIDVVLEPRLGVRPALTHHWINAQRVISLAQISEQEQQMNGQLRRGLELAKRRLDARGVGPELQKHFFSAVGEQFDPAAAIATAGPGEGAVLRQAYGELTDEFSQTRAKLARQWNEQATRPETLETDARGRVRLRVEPYSVHLLIFTLEP